MVARQLFAGRFASRAGPPAITENSQASAPHAIKPSRTL